MMEPRRDTGASGPRVPDVCWLPPVRPKATSSQSPPGRRDAAGDGLEYRQPTVRCIMDISGGMTSSKITIKGCAIKGAKRFTISLEEDISGKSVGLYLNPQFEEQVVVRNACENQEWGEEDIAGQFPFQENIPFDISIEPKLKEYRVCVNNEEFCIFSYRMVPCQRFHILKVEGDIQISQINLDWP